MKAGEYLMLTFPENAGITLLEAPSTEVALFPAPTVGQTVSQSAQPTEGFTLGFNADIEYSVPDPPISPPTIATPSQSPPAVPPAAAPSCTVPKVKGKKLKAAKRSIRAAGCSVGTIVVKDEVTPKTGTVVKQKPGAGSSKPKGSKVNLTLG